MNMAQRSLLQLLRDKRGSVVIETAIVAPVLLVLSLGAFDMGRLVARQSELQSAVAEVGQIAIAIRVDTQTERDKIKAILVRSTGTAASNVTVSNSYRCGAANTTTTTESDCVGSDMITTYLDINITESKAPLWNNFGIGNPITYRVNRKVILS